MKRKQIGIVLVVLMFWMSFWTSYQNVHAETNQNYANLIFFISFSDTDLTYWDEEAADIDRIYNTTETYTALSVADYFELASCGKLQLTNIMPQFITDSSGNLEIVPITLPNTTDYYESATDDYALLRDVISCVNASDELVSRLTGELDYNRDGYIDNVTFVVASPMVDRDSQFFSHKASGAGYGLAIGGKILNVYNVMNYGTLSNATGGAGLVAHEFIHGLGPLDTYRVCNDMVAGCGEGPVGCWDVMAETCAFVQYPLAYTRKELGWITIPEVTESGSYTLTSPQKNSNKYAMILKTPYSDNEIFVVEYRKQGSFYNVNPEDKIDSKIGGSGIIVYRVNLAASPKSNLSQDYIYVFRKGETSENATTAKAREAFLSSQSGRTSYGSADIQGTAEAGAITYTDGTNSGIVISDVGSAGGDSITFRIEYTIDMEGKYWKTEQFDTLATTYDTGVGLHPLFVNNQLYGTNLKTFSYGNQTYGLYSNASGKAELLIYKNGVWNSKKVLTSGFSYDMDYEIGTDGLLYIVCEENYSTFRLFSLNQDGNVKDITGKFVPSGGSVVNPELAVTTRGIVVGYRDYIGSDTIRVFKKEGNQWNELHIESAVAGNTFQLEGNGRTAYLSAAYGSGNQIYACDLGKSNTFTKYREAYTDHTVTAFDMFFDEGDNLYVAYYDTVRDAVLVQADCNGTWQQLGMNVYDRMVGSVNALVHNGTVYVAYQGSAGKGIKSYCALPQGETDETVQYTDVESFIVRLYDKCLWRTPDQEGWIYWKKMLETRTQSGAQVGYGFVFSKEYMNKNVSDEEFVEMLYEVFLDRNSDEVGKAYWVDMLQQGMSREFVFRGFAMSSEYTQICADYGIGRGEVILTQPRDMNVGLTQFVNRLYVKALERNGEPDGINYWCHAILTRSKTTEEAAEGFILSKEFINKNLSDSEYVKVLYLTFFDREYDEEGYLYWMQKLQNGISREEVLHGFSRSREFHRLMEKYGIE